MRAYFAEAFRVNQFLVPPSVLHKFSAWVQESFSFGPAQFLKGPFVSRLNGVVSFCADDLRDFPVWSGRNSGKPSCRHMKPGVLQNSMPRHSYLRSPGLRPARNQRTVFEFSSPRMDDHHAGDSPVDLRGGMPDTDPGSLPSADWLCGQSAMRGAAFSERTTPGEHSRVPQDSFQHWRSMFLGLFPHETGQSIYFLEWKIDQFSDASLSRSSTVSYKILVYCHNFEEATSRLRLRGSPAITSNH